MPSQSRYIFLNLPVKDLSASMEFFRALGFGFDEKFTDDSAACMVISEHAFVMLLVESRFADFTTKPTADARSVTGAIIAVSAEDRAGVDSFTDAALAAGASPAKDAQDYGFMYSRSFHDLDGHQWEVLWMDQQAIEQGPPDMAQSA